MAFSKNSTAGVVFALPFIIGFFVFMVIPMGMSLYYSFCEFEILGAPEYRDMGFDSPGSLAVWFFHADFSFCIKADFNLPL